MSIGLRRYRVVLLTAVLGLVIMFAAGGVAAVGASPAGGVAPASTSPGASPATIGRAAQLSPSLALDGSPAVPATNPRTHTLYVPIQCTTTTCDVAGNVVDVINTATCNSRTGTGCRIAARVKVGNNPLVAVVDPRTDTVYVVNAGDNTISVIDGSHCNARTTGDCASPVATINIPAFAVDAVLDPVSRTLYVASPAGFVFVVDTATCNANTTSGCSQPVRQVADNRGPQALDVDMATDTVYTADAGDGSGNTVSVINGATCNGAVHSGCNQVPHTVTVGSGAWWDTVDQATDTVYVANNNDGTVSVIDGATCNATVTSGCGAKPPAVTTGAAPQFVADDPALHTLFTLNQVDNTLSAINTRICNGPSPDGCPRTAPARSAAPDQGPRYLGYPNTFVLAPSTDTAYLINVGGASVLSAVSIASCNALTSRGCRPSAPTAAEPAGYIAADPATHTVYASNQGLPRIDVLDSRTCRAGDLTRCAPVAVIPMADPFAALGSIDHRTHTLYAADQQNGRISVIDTATCNAADTTGCNKKVPTIAVGDAALVPTLNPATHTIYVPVGDPTEQIAVIDASTCNAMNDTGCGQTPATVEVGPYINNIAVSIATDTVYVPTTGPQFTGDTVSMIDGATCDATNHSGCSQTPPTVRVGILPFASAVDDRTHTVYVSNNADGDAPGTVSVIDSATCNATNTTGCAHVSTMATGHSPLDVAVDPRTDSVVVSDFASADVTILDGARCNATVIRGCGQKPVERAVGSEPFRVAVDPAIGTMYVSNGFQAGSMSVEAIPMR